MARAAIQKESTAQPYETASPDDLLLDPNNPRLSDYAIGNNPTQFELAQTLWQKMAVDELAMSIANNHSRPAHIKLG